MVAGKYLRAYQGHIYRAPSGNDGDVELPKVLVSMQIVLQLPLRLISAQSYSIWIIVIDRGMFNETIFQIMFSSLMLFGTKLCISDFRRLRGLFWEQKFGEK